MRVTILLDTNFLIMMARGLIPPSSIGDVVKASYTLATTDAVIRELSSMRERGGLLGRAASFALELTKRLDVAVIATGHGDADKSLLELAKALRLKGEVVAVATSDKELRRRLKEAGVPTIYYREEGATLEVDWEPLQ
ncbi:MAG: PIN domain-containing protein [Acidilobus sp.]